ncbi:unnamed protein product [Cylindrotheca closterium]|uniref:Reverse transcriptase Ty1/copia-type domain-containing protein n=1 Tax=Cylindrotheca closterium TaxID=2856 RepID=A0AAD2CUK1_9STRA|nr:unnamed protein product [Cylindrotheca closterium]
MEKEIASPIAMNCFTFHLSDYTNSQFAPLRMILKPSKMDDAKEDCVRLLAHHGGLTILHGDVCNAFITAKCLEEIHSTACPEFGECESAVVTINKALYGLRSSSRVYRETFAPFMFTIGFEPTRYDRDVWMRLGEGKSGYNYLCTHVNNFKNVSKDPQRWVNAIVGAFQLKCSGAPDYHLGPASHPETDASDFLHNAGKCQYQMLVGMVQWAITIRHMDIAYGRFPSKQLPVCSDPLEIHPTLLDKKGDFIPNFLKEYPDAKEDRDPKEPKASRKSVQTSVFFDANLAHNLQTCHSITGLLVYVGIEEDMSLRYMLRSLGFPVEEPTNLIEDNLGVIQTASIPEADLKKKHVVISYHCVREAVAAQIVKPIWCDTSKNCAETLGGVKLNAILSRTML